jgi:hypothetical protein
MIKLEKMVDSPRGGQELRLIGYFNSLAYLTEAIKYHQLAFPPPQGAWIRSAVSSSGDVITEIPEDSVFQLNLGRKSPYLPSVEPGDLDRDFYILCYPNPAVLGGWVADWFDCGAEQVLVERLEMNGYTRPDGTCAGPKMRGWFYHLTIKAAGEIK